ncbi:ATP-binding protein [Dactylosporangium sp. NPDC005555]|uniref:HAMP domain-containing sensor histidine kinase n=1 Tax=Dactylosporangium sp. NPDC005555 TaxID=3154889 RepID=UPI0033B7A67E
MRSLELVFPGGGMLSRLGLRSRMAVSYVLVSAVAVLVVEAGALAILLPRMMAARDSVDQARQRLAEAEADAVQSKVARQAVETAAGVGERAARAAASVPGRSDAELLTDAGLTGQTGGRVAADADPVVLLALTTVDGRVLGSTAEGVLPTGSTVTAAAGALTGRGGRVTVDGRAGAWATSPVRIADPAGAERVVGVVYVRMLIDKDAFARKDGPPEAPGPADPVTGLGGLLVPGGVVLLMLIPVGALFGLLSTGPLIHRIRRLAQGTAAMADGDLRTRLPVTGDDEVARLERSFNAMAERLETAVAAERAAAGAEARRAERNRITRELHDSISQDLFSASLLAGGLRKALPDGSALRHQAASLEQSLERTKREMRAMLLELRPVALEDAGLAEALAGLCRGYQERLGVAVTAHLEAERLGPPVEHAVLRVVQEALSNAVRHGRPDSVELRVTRTGERLTITVHDDGRGFDPASAGDRQGMGLRLMRDRVGELGGTVDVVSAPDRGTTVRVLLPVGAA